MSRLPRVCDDVTLLSFTNRKLSRLSDVLLSAQNLQSLSSIFVVPDLKALEPDLQALVPDQALFFFLFQCIYAVRKADGFDIHVCPVFCVSRVAMPTLIVCICQTITIIYSKLLTVLK